jgi:hypothetical protein
LEKVMKSLVLLVAIMSTSPLLAMNSTMAEPVGVATEPAACGFISGGTPRYREVPVRVLAVAGQEPTFGPHSFAKAAAGVQKVTVQPIRYTSDRASGSLSLSRSKAPQIRSWFGEPSALPAPVEVELTVAPDRHHRLVAKMRGDGNFEIVQESVMARECRT